jgi:hypothetical protein
MNEHAFLLRARVVKTKNTFLSSIEFRPSSDHHERKAQLLINTTVVSAGSTGIRYD